MYQANPMEFLQMIKSGKNPQQLMLSFMEQQMQGTPMGDNLIRLAKQGDTKNIEKIVRNLAQQNGIDYDKEFPAFRQMLGL